MGKSASGKDHIYAQIAENPELHLKKIVLYTTRPARDGEENGKQYYFVDDARRKELQESGCVVESRSYETVHGIWTYFTVDDGQIELEKQDYIAIGTLESFLQMKAYFGSKAVCPLYIEVEDGERLARALKREREQENPHYEEMCRRFLADQADFSEENIRQAGIGKRFPNNDDLGQCVREITDYIKMMQKS